MGSRLKKVTAEEIGVTRHLESRKGSSPGCFPVWMVMTDVEEGAMVGDHMCSSTGHQRWKHALLSD
jgi:hypothetical protein